MSNLETIPQRYLDQAVALDYLMQPPEDGQFDLPNVSEYMKSVVTSGLDAVGLERPKFLTPTSVRGARLLTSFGHFAPLVYEFLESGQKHPDFVELSPGSGIHSRGFEFNDPLYGAMVLRVPRIEDEKLTQIYEKTAVQVLLNGLRYTEDIVATSFDMGVTVARKIPGEQFIMSEHPGDLITKRHVKNLAETIADAYKAGVALDPKQTNLFHAADVEQAEGGFYFIDMGPGVKDPDDWRVFLGITGYPLQWFLSPEQTEVYARHAAAILPACRKEILEKYGVGKK